MNSEHIHWEEITVLETAIDDMNPEFYPYIIERLLAKGARDAYIQPIIMKKGRPGIIITVLTHKQNAEQIIQTLFSETSTLGIRLRHESRACLARDFITVNTSYGPVRVKLAFGRGREKPPRYNPEFEDCRKLALEKGIPIMDVYKEALLLAERNK